MQQHFCHKYTFRRVPNQVENLQKFQGLGGYDKHPLQCIMEIPGGWGGGGSKVKVPFMGGMDIFWNYTVIDMLLARFLVANF